MVVQTWVEVGVAASDLVVVYHVYAQGKAQASEIGVGEQETAVVVGGARTPPDCGQANRTGTHQRGQDRGSPR